VESSAIKRGIKNVYVKFLTKGHYLFIYLSLKIDPYKIDVNIYPNKFKVSLLNQDETIAEIYAEINN
jgi:DNA mismatch repair protein MLH1